MIVTTATVERVTPLDVPLIVIEYVPGGVSSGLARGVLQPAIPDTQNTSATVIPALAIDPRCPRLRISRNVASKIEAEHAHSGNETGPNGNRRPPGSVLLKVRGMVVMVRSDVCAELLGVTLAGLNVTAVPVAGTPD